MEKLKTVKEVCELTGLNRKLLYVYDKEGIVKPSAYKNMGHEGMARKTGVKVDYDGYKLYDEAAVMKLQQIAIYEKLNIKRADIKALFASTKSNRELLEDQIKMLQQKKKDIEELIIVAEQLKLTGMKGEIVNLVAGIDFSKLAKTIDKMQNSKEVRILEETLNKSSDEADTEIEKNLDKLFVLLERKYESERVMETVEELFALIKKHYGFAGYLGSIGAVVGFDGGGEAFEELSAEVGEESVAKYVKVVMDYVDKDIDKLWEELTQILIRYHDAIGKDYKNPKVRRLVEETKNLLFIHTGAYSKEDYEFLFDMLQLYDGAERDYSVRFMISALEYYHKNA